MPTPSVSKILTEADKLITQSSVYQGLTLEAEVFERFYSHLATLLDAHYDHVEASIGYLLGKQLTSELLQNLCVRLAANRQLLRTRAVTPWRGQGKDEWCMAVITAARQEFKSNGDKGGLFRLYIVSGTAAGMTTSTWWSSRLCLSMARRLGFPRHRGDKPIPIYYRHPRDLVRLRISIKLNAGATDRPTFRETKVPRTLNEFNRRLLKKRFRVSQPCPKDYDNAFPCHNCPHGFDECAMATHASAFTEQTCSQCKKSNTFDTDFSKKICLDCLERPHGTKEGAKA